MYILQSSKKQTRQLMFLQQIMAMSILSAKDIFNEMYNILILMKMHRYSPMVLFYKKYKCSSSTETYITAIFYRPIFKRMSTILYNQLALHGGRYAGEVAFKVLNTLK